MVIAFAGVGRMLFRGEGEQTKTSTTEPPISPVTAGVTTEPGPPVDEKNAQATAQTDDTHAGQIPQLLAQAKNSFRELRLTSPAGNNAYEQYRQVLALDPENEQARTGLQQISDKYIALAYGAMKANNTGKARLYIKKAQEIMPESDKIQPAQQALQARMDESAKHKENTVVKNNASPALAEEPAQEQQDAEKKTEESGGLVSDVKKWFRKNVEGNKNTGNQKGTGDQFLKSIGGAK